MTCDGGISLIAEFITSSLSDDVDRVLVHRKVCILSPVIRSGVSSPDPDVDLSTLHSNTILEFAVEVVKTLS